MRPIGPILAVLFAAAPAAFAQAPLPPTPPPAGTGLVPVRLPTPGGDAGAATGQAPVAAPTGADPALVAHLEAWEKVMTGTSNFRSDFETARKEATFGREQKLKGSVLCMKPNLARLRLDEVDDRTGTKYEAYIINGKSVFHYDGSQKALTEYPIDPSTAAAGGDNLMIDFLSGMKATDALRRFEMALFKTDAHYVYLDIKPRLPRDRQEFDLVRFAVYGPDTKHLAYLPAQVFLKKPNGDTEVWKFTNPQTNLVGIEAKVFQAVAPPPGWTVRRAAAPATPVARPMK